MELNRRELNVLRRLLNRPNVTPQDVARLELARLESAQGMGNKGLTNVLAWLAENGFPLQVNQKFDEHHRQQRLDHRLRQAQNLLEQWGWQVKTPPLDMTERDT